MYMAKNGRNTTREARCDTFSFRMHDWFAAPYENVIFIIGANNMQYMLWTMNGVQQRDSQYKIELFILLLDGLFHF